MPCDSCVLSAGACQARRPAGRCPSQLSSCAARACAVRSAGCHLTRAVLCWQAAVCALRELLQWRSYAGLYDGCQLRSAEAELVHMKARLRALEAFEKLGNWGQVRWGRHGTA